VSLNNERVLSSVDEQYLLERLKPRLAVEEYFERSGRTFRKSGRRLWFEMKVKPRLIEAAFRALGIYRRGVRNALTPQVRRLAIQLPGLPADLDGFTILQISDLHIDRIDGLAEALLPLLKGLHPDLCVLTGDYRYEINGPCDEVYPRLQTVLSGISAKHGTFAILGNHDAAEIALYLEHAGVHMLVNDAVGIRHGNSTLWLIGVDDVFDYRCADLPAAMASVPADGFKVLLAHSPQMYAEAEERGIHLYLCGHTHAGQIRLPLIGAVKKNVPCSRTFVQDHWTHRGMHGYTTAGAGCSTLPVRLNCPPEVALIQLKAQ
jgi:uncharacterized protein